MPTLHNPQRPWMKKPDKKAETQRETPAQKEARLALGRFYRTKRWAKIRALHLQEHPLCVDCEKLGNLVEATVVDHIKPIRQGGDPVDPDNLQSQCELHHNRKRQTERYSMQQYRNRNS